MTTITLHIVSNVNNNKFCIKNDNIITKQEKKQQQQQ